MSEYYVAKWVQCLAESLCVQATECIEPICYRTVNAAAAAAAADDDDDVDWLESFVSYHDTHTHAHTQLGHFRHLQCLPNVNRETLVCRRQLEVCRTCRLTFAQLFSGITLVEVYVNPAALYQVYKALIAAVMRCCMRGLFTFLRHSRPHITAQAQNATGHWSCNTFIRWSQWPE